MFQVDRIEPAVAAVVGIEYESVDAVAVSAGDIEPMEQSWPIVPAVEVQILGELPRLLVEDVERAVHIDDKQPVGPAGFFTDAVDAREEHLVRRLADGKTRNGH
jgi:hypothetical protein